MDAPIDATLIPIYAVLRKHLAPVYSLMHEMLKQHRVEKILDSQTYIEQYLVRCPACDGVTVITWRPGEPEYKCKIVIKAGELGLS